MDLVVESHIDGAFRGWPGYGVFRLANGQVWKMVHYRYSYHYRYRPVAKVWRDGSKHFLDVEGMGEMVEVRRGSSSDLIRGDDK